MQSDPSKPDASKKETSTEKPVIKEKAEKSETPKKEEKTVQSLSQGSPKTKEAKSVKVDEEAPEGEDTEKKTQKDNTDTQELINSVKKSSQKLKETTSKPLKFDMKKAKKDKK